MTTAFENETIDHCLTAYQHHIDYGKAYLISHNKTKGVRLRKLFAIFRFAEIAFLEERSDPPPHHPPAAMHISSISTSAFIKTCDTSVALKLQCSKMQACSLVIISVQSSCLVEILGSGPLRSFSMGRPLN